MSITDTANKVRHRLIVEEIAAERRRQMEVEGWTPQHDDAHTDGSLAQAAVCYATPPDKRVGVRFYASATDDEGPRYLGRAVKGWPDSWDVKWWKPKDRRRDLVRAAALIVAEIERQDRIDAALAEVGK